MSNSIWYMTFGGLGAGEERKSERGVWTMMEFAFGFIWVVVMRLESGSARLSVNFPYSLGFFGTRWRETGPEANGGCPSPPVSLPGPPPKTSRVTPRCPRGFWLHLDT